MNRSELDRRHVGIRAVLVCAVALGASACGKKSNDNQGMSPANGDNAGTGAAGGAGTNSGASGSSASGTGASGSTSTASGGKGSASGGTTGASGSAAGTSGTRASAGASGGMASAGTGGASTAGASGASSSAGGCSRDSLKAGVDTYFAAIAAHSAAMLPTAAMAKFTENGKAMMLGEGGMWTMAGAVKFKRNVLDTMICTSVTEAVVPEGTTDRIMGLRLKWENQKVTEVETIVVRSGDYILNNPSGLSGTSKDDWETVLPVDQQPTRDQLKMMMEVYITRFPNGACNIASDCTRVEDGGSVGPCTGSGIGCSMTGTAMGKGARLYVLDVEAGITVGFWIFGGQYTDFHLFKVRMGMTHGVHAVLAKATSSGWD